ncbi:MAG: hypothetical protein KGM24_04040, partial [Elusimicrobia bacterium]|nr:hypothetical protein [Elusimicrobiota bacterium]
MCYNTRIVNPTTRRFALGALAALAAAPAAAQQPRPADRAPQLAMVLPADGPASAARLEQLFDAAALRRGLAVPSAVVVPRR